MCYWSQLGTGETSMEILIKSVTCPSCHDGPSVEELPMFQSAKRLLTILHERDISAQLSAHFRDWATNPNNYVFMAYNSEEVAIGMAWLNVVHEPGRTTGVVNDVVVDPAYRGRGLGEMLMGALEDQAIRVGCTRLKLTSRPSRKSAHRLYEKMGYKKRETDVFQRDL